MVNEESWNEMLSGLSQPAPTELPQEIRNAVRGIYAMYREYVAAGFTEPQALYLVGRQLTPGGGE